MRLPFLLALLIVLSGCSSPQRIDRQALDQRYQATQLADGVLSVIPLRSEIGDSPPLVVNWWYAGTSDGLHELVYRDLTWDAQGNPTGNQVRYRIAADQLKLDTPFAYMRDDARWVPLYEAAPNEIEPPADLPTARKAPKPIETNPIRQPDPSVLQPQD